MQGRVSSLCAGNAARGIAESIRKICASGDEGGGDERAAVIVVTSKTRRYDGVVEKVQKALEEMGTAERCFFGERCDIAVQHVPEEVVDEACRRASAAGMSKVVLVAIGGGSVIGLAKATAAALETSADIVAAATTYAGSELTNIFGVKTQNGKVVRRDDRVRPTASVFDPDLVKTLPRAIAITSAWNACAHAIGALMCDDVSPLVHRKAEDGLRSIVDGFRLVLDSDDKDGQTLRLDAVEKLQWGSFLCGSVLHECSMGVHHKLAHLLGGGFGMDHSSTHTALLPFTLSLNFNLCNLMRSASVPSLGRSGEPCWCDRDLQKQLRAPTNAHS